MVVSIAIILAALLVLVLLVTGKARTTFVARPSGASVRGAVVVFSIFVFAVLLAMVIHAL